MCAGSFRNTSLVETLNNHFPDNCIIDVITTSPNRYQSYKKFAPRFERKYNLNITRIPLPSHKSGLIDQIFAFSVYFFYTLKITKRNNYKMIFASTSRLMTGFLGALISKTRNIPLYLDIRDIFFDTINNVYSLFIYKLISPIISLVENFTITTSVRVNLVSEGFNDYFITKYPNKIYRFFTNGIDEELLDYNFNYGIVNDNSIKTLLYAGNVGEGQGLELIIPGLAKTISNDWKIIIIGSGGTIKKLKNEVNKMKLNNVFFFNPVPRTELLFYYKEATCLLLHLNVYPSLDKVLPSKLMEYGATGKPIIAGVSGYCRKFINDELDNVTVFKPGRVVEALDALKNISYDYSDRNRFRERYRRKTIVKKMADDILYFLLKNEGK